MTEYYLAWNELTPKTAKHGEDVCDHDWAARPHPLLRINSGLFKEIRMMMMMMMTQTLHSWI